jgi:hypothetical protein
MKPNADNQKFDISVICSPKHPGSLDLQYKFPVEKLQQITTMKNFYTLEYFGKGNQ